MSNAVNRNNQPEKTSQSEQHVLNYSFDELYKILMVGIAAYNGTTSNYDRIQIDNASGGLKVAVVAGGGGGGGTASSVTINDPTVTSQQLAVDASGRIGVNINGSVPVTGSFYQATQPISAAALPLPAGAATEATLASVVQTEDAASAGGEKGLLALGVRQDADVSPVSATGDFHQLLFDEVGRLKVGTQPGSFPLITGNITANAQTVFCDVSRASNVMISMVATTLVGHNVTFEGSLDSTTGSDGNWFGIQAIRSNANTIELTTGVLAATPAYAWEASVNGLSFVRVRATAHTSGTATWKFQRGSYATEPIPAAQISGTQPVSGSVTATPATPTASIVNSAASTNATSVKASAGTVYSITASNTNAAARYVKLYNLAAAPTVGTSVPAITIAVPAAGSVNIPFGAVGMRFGTGIALAITGAAADSDTTAVAANEVKVLTSYI